MVAPYSLLCVLSVMQGPSGALVFGTTVCDSPLQRDPTTTAHSRIECTLRANRGLAHALFVLQRTGAVRSFVLLVALHAARVPRDLNLASRSALRSNAALLAYTPCFAGTHEQGPTACVNCEIGDSLGCCSSLSVLTRFLTMHCVLRSFRFRFERCLVPAVRSRRLLC